MNIVGGSGGGELFSILALFIEHHRHPDAPKNEVKAR